MHARTHTHTSLPSAQSFFFSKRSPELSTEKRHRTLNNTTPPLPLTCNPTHLLPPLLLLCLSYCAQFHTEWIRDLTRLVSLQQWCGAQGTLNELHHSTHDCRYLVCTKHYQECAFPLPPIMYGSPALKTSMRRGHNP